MKEVFTTGVIILTTITFCVLSYLFFMKGALIVSTWQHHKVQTASVHNAIESTWVQFAPEGKKFSSFFPRLPQLIAKDYPIGKIEIMSVDDGGEVYEVLRIVADKPLKTLPTQEDIKSFIYNFADARNEEVESIVPFTNGISFKMSADKLTTEGRVYAPNTDVLFIVLYTAPGERFNESHRDMFIGGFNITS